MGALRQFAQSAKGALPICTLGDLQGLALCPRSTAEESPLKRKREQMFTLNSAKISKIELLITTNVCELCFALPKM